MCRLGDNWPHKERLTLIMYKNFLLQKKAILAFQTTNLKLFLKLFDEAASLKLFELINNEIQSD